MQNSNKPDSQENSLLKKLKKLTRVTANDFLHSLEQKHAQNRISLEDFINQQSVTLDNTILKAEQQEKLNYQAGNATLCVVNENAMQFHADLYYKDEQNSWIRKQIQSPIMDMEIYLNDEAVSELKNQTEMTFAVEKPITKK